MGFIFNNDKDEHGCANGCHHFPDEYKEKDELDLIGPQDINRHEDFGEDDPFGVEVYRKNEKRCMHENCHKKKEKWVKITSIPTEEFIELMKLFATE